MLAWLITGPPVLRSLGKWVPVTSPSLEMSMRLERSVWANHLWNPTTSVGMAYLIFKTPGLPQDGLGSVANRHAEEVVSDIFACYLNGQRGAARCWFETAYICWNGYGRRIYRFVRLGFRSKRPRRGVLYYPCLLVRFIPPKANCTHFQEASINGGLNPISNPDTPDAGATEGCLACVTAKAAKAGGGKTGGGSGGGAAGGGIDAGAGARRLRRLLCHHRWQPLRKGPSPEAVDLISEVTEEGMGEGASDTASDAAVLDMGF